MLEWKLGGVGWFVGLLVGLLEPLRFLWRRLNFLVLRLFLRVGMLELYVGWLNLCVGLLVCWFGVLLVRLITVLYSLFLDKGILCLALLLRRLLLEGPWI